MDLAIVKLKQLLTTYFDIREGEFARILLMQVQVFLIISTLLIVKPAVNGLFLAHFGVEELPKAYLLVALTAVIVSSLYSYFLRRYTLFRLFNITLYVSIAVLILLAIVLRFDLAQGSILYFFYLWVSIFAVLATSQFWILANLVFNAREAKRLFGFIGAGAISGGIFGGYLTTILAPIIDTHNLLFICAGFLACCLPITRYIWTRHVLPEQSVFSRDETTKEFNQHPLTQILRSRHLTYLALMVGVSVLVARLVDFQFSAVASAQFKDPDELTAFFGFWFSTINVLSLGIQVIFTRKIVGVFGVGVSLLFLPMGLFFSLILLLIFPGLVFAISTKLIDGSLKQSVNKAAMELLALPIPLSIKNQTKTFIDVVVDSLATGLGGLILIFVVSGMDMPVAYVGVITIPFLLVWGWLVMMVRKEYVKAFKSKLATHQTDLATDIPNLENDSVLEGLKRVLREGNDRQMTYVLAKISEKPDARLVPDVSYLLNHPNADIQAAAIRFLYYFPLPDFSKVMEGLIHSNEEPVAMGAFEYLISRHPADLVEWMEVILNDDNPEIRRAAFVSLAQEVGRNPVLKDRFGFLDRVEKILATIPHIQDRSEAKKEIITTLKVISAARLVPFFPWIREELLGPDPDIAGEAAKACGITTDPFFLQPLLEGLTREDIAHECREALVRYGAPLISWLQALVEDPTTNVATVALMPQIIERIGSQASVVLLMKLFDFEDFTVKMEALRGLNSLKVGFPFLRFDQKLVIRKILEEGHLYNDTVASLHAQILAVREKEADPAQEARIETARHSLIHLLEQRLDGNLERIFRLLGLRYPPDDIIPIYYSLRNPSPDIQINAIEYLDNLLGRNLKQILIPIVETNMYQGVSEQALNRLKIKVPSEYECFDMLMKGQDPEVKHLVMTLIVELDDPDYISLVAPYTKSSNAGVREAAFHTLKHLLKRE
ncbi:MAG: MFS transporter [Bacteroidia bacterium]|nr:MFS transporter [Bacteroidia bacterium]